MTFLLAMTWQAAAQEHGAASATGSDSLTLNGHAYQLFGIDGFGFNQGCFVDGRPLACGVSALRALQTLLAPGPVSCTPKGTSASGVTLASCTGFDDDIALRLVEQGWALADRAESEDYVAAEAAAREAQAGAWRGTFLAPEAYRAQIAAIEARYAALAADSARAEAEANLAKDRLELGGVAAPASAETSGASFKEHELRFGAFAPGFIDAAIEPPEVFDWTSVATMLEATRGKGAEAIGTSVVDAVFAELAERPSETIDTRDGEDFHAALKSRSAGWMAEERQPILFVMAPDLPNWVREWFAGEPPAGAEISRRQDRVGPGYLGTIDGVDVHLGPGRQRAALLVPSDILAGVTFRKNADGRILALEVEARNEWVLRYGMALDWRSDLLVWLAFPQMSSATPDAY